MRESQSKLIETCELKTGTVESFLHGIDQSSWLKHVKAVLEASLFISESLAGGVSVLVHCSDGWDRTSQTCALAQLMIDPYYRTIQVEHCNPDHNNIYINKARCPPSPNQVF